MAASKYESDHYRSQNNASANEHSNIFKPVGVRETSEYDGEEEPEEILEGAIKDAKLNKFLEK